MALTERTVGRRTKDRTGERYHMLSVVSYAGKNKHGQPMWNCACDCGNTHVVSGNRLQTNTTKSCGCWKSEIKRTHGKSGTKEYSAYLDAKDRCNNNNSQVYSYYGDRGIEFRFDSFEEFYAELGDAPEPTYSLDRIDNNGHYEAGNVRWASKSDQVKNRREYDKPWLDGNNHNAKSYVVVHPNGHRENVTNMAQFCRDYDLDMANLHATISGKNAKAHKGYKAELI